MSWRGNSYDGAQAESLVGTLKIERVHVGECGAFEDVAADLLHFIGNINNAARLHSAPGYMGTNRLEQTIAPDGPKWTLAGPTAGSSPILGQP